MGEAAILNAITLLLLFQLAGEAIALLFALPVPGPMIGMAVLFAALALRGGSSERTADRDAAAMLIPPLMRWLG